MRRREFIRCLGGAVAWPMAAQAQQPGWMRRIGVLMAIEGDDPERQSLDRRPQRAALGRRPRKNSQERCGNDRTRAGRQIVLRRRQLDAVDAGNPHRPVAMMSANDGSKFWTTRSVEWLTDDWLGAKQNPG